MKAKILSILTFLLLNFNTYSQWVDFDTCKTYTTVGSSKKFGGFHKITDYSNCSNTFLYYEFGVKASFFYISNKNSYSVVIYNVNNGSIVLSKSISSLNYFETFRTTDTKELYYNYKVKFILSDFPEIKENLSFRVERVTVNECVSYGAELATFVHTIPSSYSYKLPTCKPDNDYDDDGVSNNNDNCPNNYNPDQADSNSDGLGDVCDSDNDGITNSNDNCPNNSNSDQADSDNDGIGDVCDSTDGNKKPDLTAKKSNILITSNCFDCNSSLSNLGSKRHLIYKNGGFFNFDQIVIDNKGNSTSTGGKINYYFSFNNKFEPNIDHIIPNSSTSIPSIPSGGYKVLSQSIDGYNIQSQSYGNRYIIMKIDGDDDIDELNEKNNIFSIPIKYKYNAFGRPVDIKSFNSTLIENTYELFIYNFYGQLVKKVSVKNRKIEIEEIKNLPNGLYILNSIHGNRKISINNK